MARARRIGNIVTFKPPSVWTGVGQLADVWGNASTDICPPRVVSIEKARSEKVSVSGTVSIKASLHEDVRKIAGDISRSVEAYVANKRLGEK